MSTPTLIAAAQNLFAARQTAEDMAAGCDYLAALVLLNEAVEQFQATWRAPGGDPAAWMRCHGHAGADGSDR